MPAERKKKRALLTMALCALSLSFTLFIFAPIEQFMLNQSEMWFNLTDIVPLTVGCFVLFTLLCVLVGALLPARARRIFSAVLLSLALCFYLQGNLLNPDYGELDGRAVPWEKYTLYGLFDSLFWLGATAGIVLFALKKRRAFKPFARWAASGLMLIQGVTVLTVLLTHPIAQNRPDWIVSDREQFTLGAEENTVVFVIDACDSTYFPDIMAQAPDALAELDGFTYFSDYAGSYSKTKMGLPYLLTGQWYENDETIESYIARCYTDTTLYQDLRSSGWDVRLYTAESYISSAMAGIASNILEQPMTVGSYPKLYGKMMAFVAFRYMPHIFKPYFVFYSGDFGFYKASEGEDQPYFKDNFLFRDKLAQQSLTLSPGKALVVYHINGSHLPCNMDENGQNVGNWNTTALSQTKGVFRTIITPYLQQMKALGVYDSANIIITADHGRFDEGPSSPLLLIKPAYAQGEICTNTAMGSVSDMQATLRALTGLSEGEGSLLTLDPTEERPRRYLYYPTTRANGGTLPPLVEYNVARGQVFVPTGVVLPGGGMEETLLSSEKKVTKKQP